MSRASIAARKLALEIAERRQQEVEQRSERRWRPSGNYASGLYDCPRAGYYNRVLWEERPPIPPAVQGRLEMGEVVHRWAQKWMMDNFNVLNVELPLNYDPWQLRGRVDMVVSVETDDGEIVRLPVEVKSITDQAWSKARSVEDLLEQEWTRKYVRQLWAYMLTAGVDTGLLLFVGLPSGNMNPVVVDLDYERAEAEVAGWCEKVNAAVAQFEKVAEGKTGAERIELADKWRPEAIEYDPTICGRCPWFGTHCHPIRVAEDNDRLRILQDPDLIASISRMKETEALAKEHEQLKKEVKAKLAGITAGIAGPWAIKGRHISSRRLKLPPAEKARIEREHPDWVQEISYWRHTIEPLLRGEKQRWEQTEVAARLRRILEQED